MAPSQALEAIVRRTIPDVRVATPGLGPELSNKCVVASGLAVAIGDRVLTVTSNEGRRWIVAKDAGSG